MICETCKLQFCPECTGNLRKVGLLPDKNGFIIIAYRCDDYKEESPRPGNQVTQGETGDE